MEKIFRNVYYFSFIGYLFIIISLLFLKSRGFISEISLFDYIKYNSNLVPFKTIYTYIQALNNGSMNMDIPIKNLLGNLLLFLPMGIYLPYIFKKLYIFGNYFKYITLILISIEIMQLILRRGSFDIDDFILNIIGAIIGFTIGKVKGIKYLMKVFEIKIFY